MNFTKEPSVFRSVAAEHDILRSIEWQGLNYVVGNEANKRSRYCTSITNVGDLLNYYELILKWYERKFDVKFAAVTLPYSLYIDSSGIVEELQERLKVEAIVGQGLAAFDYLKATNNADDKTTLIIDGGFNTINIIVVEGNEVAYYETYFNQVGTRDLIEKYFKPLIRKKIPDVSTNPIRLDELLKKGYTDFNFKRISFTEEKREAIERYIFDIFKQVKSGLSTELIDFEQVAIVGGLAYYISPNVLETSKTLIIPSEHSEYLNVLGASLAVNYKPAMDLGFGYTKIIK